jgi:hypothetical protein
VEVKLLNVRERVHQPYYDALLDALVPTVLIEARPDTLRDTTDREDVSKPRRRFSFDDEPKRKNK